MWETFEPSPRDILIHRVRVGEITPEEAEIEAQRLGVGPLATKPNPIDFDPSQMPDWSLPMALAWIAWRTTDAVREHCADYREKCLLWSPGSWNIPTGKGIEFKRIDGYELKSLRRSTSVRLSLVELYLSSKEKLPPTSQMSIAKAEKELFAALAAGHLGAIAKDDAGRVVEVPQREWPYLKLFEEQESDVLKHNALDATPAFTEIKFWRKDLQRLWEEFLVQPYMIEPMTRTGTAGYVPLCAALHWIMTEGGRLSRNLEDSKAWSASVQLMLPLISTGEIQIIGRPSSGGPAEPIAGETFAGVFVSHATKEEFSVLVGTNPWIGCTCYIDDQHWSADFNDQLFLSHYGSANWTHLQVKKSDVLREIKFDERKEIGRTVYVSGAPGRPTSMNLIRQEFEARHGRGDTAGSITKEAAALANWLAKDHPAATPVTAKTIKNQLADQFRKRNSQK